jgi:hypothetical protein
MKRRTRSRPFRVVTTCPHCGAPVFSGLLYDGQTVVCDLSAVASRDGRRLVAYVMDGVTRVRPCDPYLDIDCHWFQRHECRRTSATG